MKKLVLISLLLLLTVSVVLLNACVPALFGSILDDMTENALEEQVPEPQEITSDVTGIVFSFPENWTEDDELNEEAAIQMFNFMDIQGFVLLEESTLDFADDLDVQIYGDLIVENFTTDEPPILSEWNEVSIGLEGIPGKQIEITGLVDHMKFKYLITVFKKDTYFYCISCWSTPSRYLEALPAFESILASAKWAA